MFRNFCRYEIRRALPIQDGEEIGGEVCVRELRGRCKFLAGEGARRARPEVRRVQICVVLCSAGSAPAALAARVILGFSSAEPEPSGLLRVLTVTVHARSQKVKNARDDDVRNRSLSVRPAR
jgi:hypothetical protein